MACKSINVTKRESNLTSKPFPFEVIHFDEPVKNMNLFHWHDFMELSYIQDGKGIYEIEDKTFQVKKGDIVIINNIERHRVTFKQEEPLFETVIHFDPSLIWSRENSMFDFEYLKLFLYSGTNFNNKPDLNAADREGMTGNILDIVSEYINKAPFHELMIKSKLLTIITILIRQYSIKDDNNYEVTVRRNNIGRIERILKYINENLNKELSLEAAARKFFMNSSYFSDYFKKNIGINFSEYIAKLRVNEAIRLMNEGSFNTTEIAYECGFNSTTSFYCTFKKITGMNPGDYKKIKINT